MSEQDHSKFWFPLALHPQFAHHDDAVIIGTVEGLIALRSMIDACLSTGQSATGATFDPGDGEGYALHIILAPEQEVRQYVGENYISEHARQGAQSILGLVSGKKMYPVLDVDEVKRLFGPIAQPDPPKTEPQKSHRGTRGGRGKKKSRKAKAATAG